MDISHPQYLRDLIERLRQHWTSEPRICVPGQKIDTIRPGVSVQEIESFEARYQVALPPDVREYFLAVDGMPNGQMDSDMFSFLPLGAVKSIPEFDHLPGSGEVIRSLADAERWFVLVDYLISSAVYAIRLSNPFQDCPILWLGGAKHHRLVAASFAEFLEAYLKNPDDLL